MPQLKQKPHTKQFEETEKAFEEAYLKLIRQKQNITALSLCRKAHRSYFSFWSHYRSLLRFPEYLRRKACKEVCAFFQQRGFSARSQREFLELLLTSIWERKKLVQAASARDMVLFWERVLREARPSITAEWRSFGKACDDSLYRSYSALFVSEMALWEKEGFPETQIVPLSILLSDFSARFHAPLAQFFVAERGKIGKLKSGRQ